MKTLFLSMMVVFASVNLAAAEGPKTDLIIPLPQGDSILSVAWRSLGGGGGVGAIHFEVACTSAGVPCMANKAIFEAPNFRVSDGEDSLRLVDSSGNSVIVGKLAAVRDENTSQSQPVTLHAAGDNSRPAHASVSMNLVNGQLELQLNFPAQAHNTIRAILPGVALQ